jgi:uncharacterized membrane protein YcgQ (UPF0703/DUF1980 family)
MRPITWLASGAAAATYWSTTVARAEVGGFRLARYQIACCAADAIPVVVRIVGINGDPPPRDQWVTVTGTFQSAADQLPELRATSVVEIRAPEDPYE